MNTKISAQLQAKLFKHVQSALKLTNERDNAELEAILGEMYDLLWSADTI